MPASSGVLRVLALSSVLPFVVVALAAGQASPQAPAQAAPPAAASAVSANSSEASKYVGAETCKTCHEEIYNAWEKTPHWKTTLNKEGGPSKQGCEGCHGPGADHVAGGGDKTKIFVFEGRSRQETSARCLTCHGESHEQSHFAESAHASSDVGCLDCHSPHHAKEKEHLLVQNQPQLCYGCHTSAKADFAKPYHHRVNEGSGAMQRLPQPARHRDRAAGADSAERRRRLLQVPRRQAGAFRLRACAGEDRGLQQLPHATRFHQSPTPQSEPGEHALSAVPHLPDTGAERACTQSVREVSGLHHVSHADSWVQLQRCLFQVREK